jgi:hypothetical protein
MLLARVLVGAGQMVGIEAELEAAEQANGALSRSPANPAIIQTLRKAYITAKRANSNLSGGLALSGARHAVGITFPDLIRAIENGQSVGENFNSAKYAVEVWIEVLRAAK